MNNQVCGHAGFVHSKLLLQRKSFWNDIAASHLTEIVGRCTSCCSIAVSQSGRKFSVCSFSEKIQCSRVCWLPEFGGGTADAKHFKLLHLKYVLISS